MGRLEGKIALVTACTRGIGRAIADRFVVEGATVYYAVRNLKTGQKAVDKANEKGPGVAKLVYFEAYDYDTHTAMIDTVVENEGRLDILVNNFGGSDPTRDLNIKRGFGDEFRRTVEVNLSTVYNASQAAINKSMLKNGGGSIINIGSVAGVVTDNTQCGYGVCKAGILKLTQMIASHCGRDNIRCNIVNPGVTATEAVKRHLTQEYVDTFLKHVPIQRMGTPEDIANAVLFFASDESSYVTGQVINVSGGYGVASPTYGDLMIKPTERK